MLSEDMRAAHSDGRLDVNHIQYDNGNVRAEVNGWRGNSRNWKLLRKCSVSRRWQGQFRFTAITL